MLKISGIAPEDLPAVDSIKKAEKRLLSQSEPTAQIEEKSSQSEPLREVDISKDLWKYALLVLAAEDTKQLSTAEIGQRLREIIVIPDEMNEKLVNRNDDKFSQLVRNIKSHKTSKTNPIYNGYAEDVSGGLKITQKGIDFIKKEFCGYI